MSTNIRYTMRFTLVDRYDEAELIERFEDLLDYYPEADMSSRRGITTIEIPIEVDPELPGQLRDGTVKALWTVVLKMGYRIDSFTLPSRDDSAVRVEL